ncbi:hypothetical protein PRIC1_010342 [Phytophthora ramorum]
METLRGVFPTVPTEALLRVLEICDQSVAVASAWLLENDWQDIMLEDEEAAAPAANIAPSAANITPSAANVTIARDADTLVQQNRVASTEVRVADRSNQDQRVTNTLPPHLTRGSTGLFGFEAEFDSEDEDEAAGIEEGDEEEDEEEDEDDVYYDSGDELGFRVGGVPPMTKRAKVFKSEGKTGDNEFWVAFDDQVMTKSMIDLLNTTLTKLAHSKVVLLSQPVKEVEEKDAIMKLRSVIAVRDIADEGVVEGGMQPPRDASNRRGIALACLLNGSTPCATPDIEETRKSLGSSESSAIFTSDVSTGQKRKRTVTADTPTRGFFAHFFPIKELDMVWRTVMHAHLFKGRFGDTIEFHTASGGAFTKRDFDELMHVQSSALSSRAASLGFSPLATLKCCLILPCLANEEEMLRVGRNIHSVLKVQGNVYYQVIDRSQISSSGGPRLDLPNDDGKLTEERFRQFSRYRVRVETDDSENPKPASVGVDPYLSYQQNRTPNYRLDILEADKWSCRLTS